ncbi:MFS transporter [Alcaligenaceae bacterium CGII-47]|nr:MFS transporter [Alcaligenaceae bacterium CGII-47]
MIPTLPVPRITSAVLLVTCFLTSNIPTAVYGVLREQLGFSATVQTLIFAVYVLGMIPALLLTGTWAARVSLHRLMVLGVVLAAVASGGLVDASSVYVLLASRLLQGFSNGILTVTCTAALYTAVPLRSRRFTALLVTVTGALGGSLGPVLGGIVADAFGRTTSAAFTLAVILLVFCLVLLLVHGKSDRHAVGYETPVAGAEISEVRQPVQHVDPSRSLLLIGLTAALPWATVGIYQSIGPSIVGAALGSSSLGALGLIVGMVMATAGVTQLLAQKVPLVLSRRIGLGIVLLSIAAFFGMLVTGDFRLAVLAAVATGVGHGFSFLSATREMGALVGAQPHRTGMLMGLYFAIAYMGLAIPSIALGLISDLWGLMPASLVVMGGLGCGCVAMMFSSNRMDVCPPSPK